MKCPKHLKHRPIIVVDDYEKIDACGSNDAKALSIGKAQWDNTSDDVSVKIFRKSGGKWSRQSEELPFPRVLDLAEFIIGTILEKETTLGGFSHGTKDHTFPSLSLLYLQHFNFFSTEVQRLLM